MAPDPLPGTLAVPALQHSALSSHRLGLDGMKMQVKCCRSSAVTERDPGMLGQPMEQWDSLLTLGLSSWRLTFGAWWPRLSRCRFPWLCHPASLPFCSCELGGQL